MILKNGTTDLSGEGEVHSMQLADIQTLRCRVFMALIFGSTKQNDQPLEFYILLFLFFGCAGFCCCTWDFSSWTDGRSSVAVLGLLIKVASLVWSTGSRVWLSVIAACGLSSCSSLALERGLSSRGA